MGEAHHLISLIQVQGSIEANTFRAMRPALRVLSVPAFARGVSPRLIAKSNISGLEIRGADGTANAWNKRDARTLLRTITADSRQGWTTELSESRRGLAGYSVHAKVAANERPWLLLKVNVFPWWHAYINNIEVPIQHVAPNFMAIQIPSGIHQITFQYENPLWQKLTALAAIILLFIAILPSAHRFQRPTSCHHTPHWLRACLPGTPRRRSR